MTRVGQYFNISPISQYGVCNNQYRTHFHWAIISLMQYIAEYCNILQCSTLGLSTQSKYASSILFFNAVTHNTHDDTIAPFKYSNCNISHNRNFFVGNNRNTVFQYRPTLLMTCCVTKATPIQFIDDKCHNIKQLKSGNLFNQSDMVYTTPYHATG